MAWRISSLKSRLVGPDSQGPQLGFWDRLFLLLWHYYPLPLIGLGQRLIVKDKRISLPDKFVALLSIGFTVLFLQIPEIPKLAYLAMASILLPIVLYTFSPVPQVVLEYRVYFSVFGISILASLIAKQSPFCLGLVFFYALFCTGLSVERTRLYRDPVRFWRQASLDCPDCSIKATYSYYLSRAGRTTDAAELLTDKLVQDLINGSAIDPQSKSDGLRLTLINLARAYVGPLECHEDLSLVRVKQAITLVEEVTRVWPDLVDGWRNLGALWYARSSIAEGFNLLRDDQICEVQRKNCLNLAIENFSRAVNLDPNDGPSWLGLGCAHMDTGTANSLEYAKCCLLTAVELMPTVEAARIKLVELLDRLQDPLLGVEHIHYLRKQGLIYVTDDMLPEHIRNRS